jgi:hypothetical protein
VEFNQSVFVGSEEAMRHRSICILDETPAISNAGVVEVFGVVGERIPTALHLDEITPMHPP